MVCQSNFTMWPSMRKESEQQTHAYTKALHRCMTSYCTLLPQSKLALVGHCHVRLHLSVISVQKVLKSANIWMRGSLC